MVIAWLADARRMIYAMAVDHVDHVWMVVRVDSAYDCNSLNQMFCLKFNSLNLYY